MTAYLSPLARQQFMDANGNPLVGGQLFTYAAGTSSTKLSTFTDSTGTTPNTNPIVLDSLGGCNLWLGAAGYKLTLAPATDTDPPTNPLWSVDQVVGAQQWEGGNVKSIGSGLSLSGAGVLTATAAAQEWLAGSVTTLGTNLSITGTTLNATPTDLSAYLTSATAAATYVPLAGATMSGGLETPALSAANVETLSLYGIEYGGITNEYIGFYTTGSAALVARTNLRGDIPLQAATPSDYRLKTVHGPAAPVPIDDIPIYDASWKDTGERYPMVLAHELAEVAPWAVMGEKDGVDAAGRLRPQIVDWPKLIPALLAYVQKLRSDFAAYVAAHP